MRRTLALLLIAAAAWGQSASRGEAPTLQAGVQGPRALHTQAEQLQHAPTDERIHAYEALLQKSPDHAQFQIGLVAAFLQKQRETADFGYLDRAAKIVNRMLDKEGGNFTALRFQNEIDLQRHDFIAVAERARSMARYNPSDSGTWGNLGDALMETGDYDGAGEAYRKMFSLRPGLDSYNRLGYWRFVTGDGPGGAALLREAVSAGSAAPENAAWCWAELGDMSFKLGRTAEAEAAYRSALNQFSRLHRAYAGLGRVEAALGHNNDAILLYEHAQAIVPLVEYAAALEKLYAAEGQTAKSGSQRALIAAIEKLTKATHEKANRNLALILADRGQDVGYALELLEREIPTRGDVYTYDALSWVLLKNGRLADAVAASAKAIRLDTPEPLFYYHARQIAAANGNSADEARYAERLASLNPNFEIGKFSVAERAAGRQEETR